MNNTAATTALAAAGITAEQMTTVTGFGLRNIAGCANVATLAEKFAAGALTITGVMSVLYGIDSVQARTGKVTA